MNVINMSMRLRIETHLLICLMNRRIYQVELRSLLLLLSRMLTGLPLDFSLYLTKLLMRYFGVLFQRRNWGTMVVLYQKLGSWSWDALRLLLRSDLLTKTTWKHKYRDATESWWSCSGKSSDCPDCLFFKVVFFFLGMLWSICDHVRFKETSFKKDIMLVELSEDSTENSFRDFLTIFCWVRTVRKDLWLNNWDKSILLTNSSIVSKSNCIFINSLVSGASITDFQDSSPFSESASKFVEFCGHCWKCIKSLGVVLSFSVGDCGKSFINFDSWNDSFRLEVLGKVDTFIGGLFGGLLMEDNSGNIVFNTRWGKKHISVSSSVLLIVFKFNRIEFSINRAWWLISSKDTFSWSTYLLGCLNKFFRVVGDLHVT